MSPAAERKDSEEEGVGEGSTETRGGRLKALRLYGVEGLIACEGGRTLRDLRLGRGQSRVTGAIEGPLPGADVTRGLLSTDRGSSPP